MRVINRSNKQSIGNTPHRLIHWAPTDLDRVIFEPFRESKEFLPVRSACVRQLELMYERLLDITSSHILAEQEKVTQRFEGDIPTEFEAGSFVLVSYFVRPPSKLDCR